MADDEAVLGVLHRLEAFKLRGLCLAMPAANGDGRWCGAFHTGVSETVLMIQQQIRR